MGYMFEVKLASDRMEAILYCRDQEKAQTSDEVHLTEVLKSNHIISGINNALIEKISLDPLSVSYPIVIAKGRKQVNGKDGYLRNELFESKTDANEKFNFRNVLDIKSVTAGQLLATAVPPEAGMDGQDVTGRIVPAKPGKPLTIKAGNNVRVESGQFFSEQDGQLSITGRSISVNPVFQVNGDLDLKTGNIHFVGNISVKGNIPSGYELIAGGDIKVTGLVEGATLRADGNVIIEGGVAGGMKGSITAGGSVQANYLNQAIVIAGQDVHITSSILHSRVSTGNDINCHQGTIIGGTLTAGRNVHVRELGNELFAKTELAIGWDPAIEKKNKEIHEAINQESATLAKLNEIESKLVELIKTAGKLTQEKQEVILKQRATRKSVENVLLELKEELSILEADKHDRLESSLFVYEIVHPNTKVYFGKYAYATNTAHRRVKFSIENSEIRIQLIDGADKTQ